MLYRPLHLGVSCQRLLSVIIRIIQLFSFKSALTEKCNYQTASAQHEIQASVKTVLSAPDQTAETNSKFSVNQQPVINYKRRPRRPPFLRVLSDGIGVTSSATITKHQHLQQLQCSMQHFHCFSNICNGFGSASWPESLRLEHNMTSIYRLSEATAVKMKLWQLLIRLSSLYYCLTSRHYYQCVKRPASVLLVVSHYRSNRYIFIQSRLVFSNEPVLLDNICPFYLQTVISFLEKFTIKTKHHTAIHVCP